MSASKVSITLLELIRGFFVACGLLILGFAVAVHVLTIRGLTILAVAVLAVAIRDLAILTLAVHQVGIRGGIPGLVISGLVIPEIAAALAEAFISPVTVVILGFAILAFAILRIAVAMGLLDDWMIIVETGDVAGSELAATIASTRRGMSIAAIPIPADLAFAMRGMYHTAKPEAAGPALATPVMSNDVRDIILVEIVVIILVETRSVVIHDLAATIAATLHGMSRAADPVRADLAFAIRGMCYTARPEAAVLAFAARVMSIDDSNRGMILVKSLVIILVEIVVKIFTEIPIVDIRIDVIKPLGNFGKTRHCVMFC